ncbi:hypothetical protein BJV82DRAFT_32393 [Fennellomyces sp. T-0311]|nr:hypothetical protein BJV82DRAFT_32393 [Fennellomyces sp. T-0311]
MDTTVEASESQKMDALMQQLMGTPFEAADETTTAEKEAESEEHPEEEEEAFAFRLFSSKPVAKVNISDKDDTADMLAALAAKQRTVDFDEETDPDFIARVQAAAITYDDLVGQSKQPYYALQLPKRVIHIPQDQGKDEKTAKKHRKSKKRRDFEKAVREGRIQVKPNIRDPATPGGWPGWPGNLTVCRIITDTEGDIKKKPSFQGGGRGRGGIRGRGGFRGRGSARPK